MAIEILGHAHQNGNAQRGHEDDGNDYLSEYGSEFGHNLLPGDFQSTFSINDLPSEGFLSSTMLYF